MADEKDSIFDRAETLARRVFERLGAKVDTKLSGSAQDFLSRREIDDLLGKIERVIEANLKADNKGVKRVAPNFFKVMFTYERALNLNKKYFENLHNELKAAIFEYITNRRYETPGQIQISIARDFFEKATAVKAAFDAAGINVNATDSLWSTVATRDSKTGESKPHVETCLVHLLDNFGDRHSFELKVNSQPACIGRSHSNRLRIDDASISRVHCSFALHSDGEVVVADLNSSNGTYVNDKFLKSNEARSIRQGDRIRVGDVVLTVIEMA
jgi:hypothetical protein